MNDPYYITTAIAYPNANPHMGWALEVTQADALARYYRLFSERPVWFQTGLDEHGLKMQRSADDAGVQVAQFVEGRQRVFRELVEKLGATPDRFIRTTDADHQVMAQAFWQRCLERGDIYKKTYRAWYDVKEEEFLASADEVTDPAVFGVDPRFLELIEEENYFFAASKYTDEVIRLLESGEYAVVPQNRAKELLNFAKDKGVQDISISRQKSKMAWGIPVPGDDTQVMYVWFDALTNYLTGVAKVDGQGIQLNQFWPAAVHCVGKDISRFHALLWPGMLLSAGLALPKKLLVHGFVLSGGKKMSKSLGNVVDPLHYLEKYGRDIIRWYLLRHIPTTDDGDFSEEHLRELYASDLANDYGNLVSRVVAMVNKYRGGAVPSLRPEQLGNLEQMLVEEKWQQYHAAFESMQIQSAAAAAQGLVVFANRRIEELKPWVLAKDDTQADQLSEVLYELVEIIRQVTLMLRPFLIDATERVYGEVFSGVSISTEWGTLPGGHQLPVTPPILFPRLEA